MDIKKLHSVLLFHLALLLTNFIVLSSSVPVYWRHELCLVNVSLKPSRRQRGQGAPKPEVSTSQGLTVAKYVSALVLLPLFWGVGTHQISVRKMLQLLTRISKTMNTVLEALSVI